MVYQKYDPYTHPDISKSDDWNSIVDAVKG